MSAPPAGRMRTQLSLSTGGTMLARLLGALGGLLAARLLGPQGRGQYALLVLIGSALGTAGTLGLQFWIARAVAAADPAAQVWGVLRRHLLRALGTTAVVTTAAVLLARLTSGVTAPEVIATGGLTAAWIASMLALAVPNGMLRLGAVAVATVSGAGVYVAVVALLVAADVDSVAWVVAGAAAGNGLAVPLCWRFVRRLEPRPISSAAYGQAVRFGGPAMVGELLSLASYRADFLLVATLLSVTEVGLYAVAVALTEALWLLPDGVAQVVLPRVARHPDERSTGRLLVLTGLFTAAGAVLLTVLAEPLITALFGDAFSDAARAVPALGVAAVAGGAWKIIAADVVGRGNSRARATSAAAGLVVMVVADLVLVPVHGILGAAGGSTMGYVASAVVVARVWRRSP